MVVGRYTRLTSSCVSSGAGGARDVSSGTGGARDVSSGAGGARDVSSGVGGARGVSSGAGGARDTRRWKRGKLYLTLYTVTTRIVQD